MTESKSCKRLRASMVEHDAAHSRTARDASHFQRERDEYRERALRAERQLATLREAARLVANSAQPIELCGNCGGGGSTDGLNACDNCGGIGEVCEGSVNPVELRALRAALADTEEKDRC